MNIFLFLVWELYFRACRSWPATLWYNFIFPISKALGTISSQEGVLILLFLFYKTGKWVQRLVFLLTFISTLLQDTYSAENNVELLTFRGKRHHCEVFSLSIFLRIWSILNKYFVVGPVVSSIFQVRFFSAFWYLLAHFLSSI